MLTFLSQFLYTKLCDRVGNNTIFYISLEFTFKRAPCYSNVNTFWNIYRDSLETHCKLGTQYVELPHDIEENTRKMTGFENKQTLFAVRE